MRRRRITLPGKHCDCIGEYGNVASKYRESSRPSLGLKLSSCSGQLQRTAAAGGAFGGELHHNQGPAAECLTALTKDHYR